MKNAVSVLIGVALLAAIVVAVPAFAGDAAGTSADTAAPAAGKGYVVQEGDTLWDITGKSLDDPFLWPRVWNGNRVIENPHLLTPGQQLVLPGRPEVPAPAPTAPAGETPAPTPAVAATAEGTGGESGEAAPVAVPTPPPTEVTQTPPAFPPSSAEAPADMPAPVALPERKAGVRFLLQAEKQELIAVLATYGFIADREETALGTVLAVESGHRLLYVGDKAELALEAGSTVAAGRTYSVAKTVRQVKNPLTGVPVGMLVRILAEVTVKSVEGQVGRGEVTALFGPAEVDDALMERVDYLSWIPREGTPAPATLTGTVLDSPDGSQILGAGAILFVDLGTRDGVGPGTRLAVWDERPETADTPTVLEERKVPPVLGEIVIVAPREKTSVARLVASRREVIPGAVVGGKD